MLQLSSLLSPFFRNVSSTGFFTATSAYLGRTSRSVLFGAVCTRLARSSRGPPQPGSTSGHCLSLRVFFTRVTRWIPRLPAEPPHGFFPFFQSISCTLLRSQLGLSGGFQRELCTSASLPLRSLSWCYPTLLSLRRMTATLRRSLPLQGPPSGHSVAYRVSSQIPLLTTRLAATGVASSSIKSSSRKVKEVTRGERESSADALSCRSWCCLFQVLCWPSCRPDKCRQSSLHMCMYAVHCAAGVALAWLPISQQVFSKEMEVSRREHRVRECV